MTESFHIARAVPADLDALLALERTAFDTDHLSRRQYRHHLTNPHAAVLVARGAAGVLGKAVLFFNRRHDIARLYSIAVGEAARGLGLGAALLAAAEHEAQRRGKRRVRLEVAQQNAGAIRLYERHGFQRIGERRGYYENGAHAWRYEKVLVGG